MLEQIPLERILFLDIETVSQHAVYEELSESMKKLWTKKADMLKGNSEITPESLYQRAAIYAEFGKIVCISIGVFIGKNFRVKSFYGDNEKILLEEFRYLLINKFDDPHWLLCAHNGKEFDFPYISRRMLINGIKLPKILDIQGKKPWEIPHLDTMELWKFGDYKNYTSLALLTAIFNIPTPKDDIDGSQVGNVYWNEKDVERIATYCQKDVIAIARLFQKYRGEKMVEEENIIYK
ncbi:MAG: 3'-5' exonuclease [Bacteroidales bacterium]|nr:3'-5' exonuclease [Bacteroidales bacterium]